MSELTLSKKIRPYVPPLQLPVRQEKDSVLYTLPMLTRQGNNKNLFGSVPKKTDDSNQNQIKNSPEKIWGSGVLGESYLEKKT